MGIKATDVVKVERGSASRYHTGTHGPGGASCDRPVKAGLNGDILGLSHMGETGKPSGSGRVESSIAIHLSTREPCRAEGARQGSFFLNILQDIT